MISRKLRSSTGVDRHEVVLDPVVEPGCVDINDALNYDDIRQTVVDIAQSRHFDLQETLARAVFNAVRSMKTVVGLRVRTQPNQMFIKMSMKPPISFLIWLTKVQQIICRPCFAVIMEMDDICH